MVVWKKTTAGKLPEGAIPCGFSKMENETLYVARAAYEGGTHIGKVGGTDRIRHAHIPYGGKEVAVEQFEVLCVDNSNIHVK